MASGSYILFDLPQGDMPLDGQFLEDLGHPVEVCNGPAHEVCPLLTGEGCPLAEDAHGIVFEFDLDRPEHREILQKYKTALRTDVPLRVAVPPDQIERYSDLLKGLKVWDHEPVAGDLDALAAETDAADLFRSREGE